MKEFSVNVLRERFTIEDLDGRSDPVIALSNRFFVPLIGDDGKVKETFIVRGQMLHTVVRMAGLIIASFQRSGLLIGRDEPVDFETMWKKAAGDYELNHNPNLWVAVYTKGKCVFGSGVPRHNFLDVIEQCEARGNNGGYESNLRVAEDLFFKAGKAVAIHYESGIACTVSTNGDTGRSALILRGAQKTTTFILMGEKRDPALISANPAHFLSAAANFFEGIQLSFSIGRGNWKLRSGAFAIDSEEGIALVAAKDRMDELDINIAHFEHLYDVYYRPEKPDFTTLIATAEASAAGLP